MVRARGLGWWDFKYQVWAWLLWESGCVAVVALLAAGTDMPSCAFVCGYVVALLGDFTG